MFNYSLSKYLLSFFEHKEIFKIIKKEGKIKLLDLGCGENKFHKNAIGIDRVRLPGVDIIWDLTKTPYPFKSSSIDAIHCAQVIEHLNLNQQEALLKECERILKKEGVLDIRVPHAFSVASYQDPTHISHFTFCSIDHFFGSMNNWYGKKTDLSLYKRRGYVMLTYHHNNSIFVVLANIFFTINLRLIIRISPILADLYVKIMPLYFVDIVWILKKN